MLAKFVNVIWPKKVVFSSDEESFTIHRSISCAFYVTNGCNCACEACCWIVPKTLAAD
jgi:hypothetical protein